MAEWKPSAAEVAVRRVTDQIRAKLHCKGSVDIKLPTTPGRSRFCSGRSGSPADGTTRAPGRR